MRALDVALAYDASGALVSETESVSIADARRTHDGAYLTMDVPVATALIASGGVRWGAWLELTLLGRNLLDEAYLVSPDARAVLATGRSALLSAAVRV